jgi:ADP-heptose:LPS heptosyltransferase
LSSPIPEALVGLGNAYVDLGLDDNAASLLDEALSFEENSLSAWCAKGMLLKNSGESEQALACFSRANQIDANVPEPKYNSSHIQLQTFNFIEGWENYEYRWKVKAFNSKFLNIDRPLWSGGLLKGSLLIWAEQGVGDQILYASILSLVLKKISNIVVLVDGRLATLFGRSFPNIRFIVSINDINLADIEAHIPMGSLGQYFLPTLENFTHRKMPYLLANNAQSKALKNTIADSSKPICGLAWSSRSMKHSMDKSFDIRELRPILNSKKMTFVDIGYLDTESERANLLKNDSIEIYKFQEVDSFNDIDALASIIDLCDFIVTCSNTCAHLAGALGKDVYLLVPQFRGRFWYWQDVDGASLWYPSVKVIAKVSNQGWDVPVNNLKKILGI